MTIIDKIQDFRDRFEEKRSKLTEELKKEFPRLICPIMKEYNDRAKVAMIDKQIEYISWTQYTPFFNDGSPCSFGTNVDYIDVNGTNIDDLPEYRGKYARNNTPEGKLNPTEFEEAIDKIKETLQAVPEDFYESMFGDHVQITLYADGRIKDEPHDQHD